MQTKPSSLISRRTLKRPMPTPWSFSKPGTIQVVEVDHGDESSGCALCKLSGVGEADVAYAFCRSGPCPRTGLRRWPGIASRAWPAPCMLFAEQLIRFFTSYWGSRTLLEAALTDLVRRVAPRLITNLEEYPEADVTRLRITRSRQYQVRGRGTGSYCERKHTKGESR